MYKHLLTALLALSLSACSCSGDEKKAPATEPTGKTTAPAAAAPEEPVEEKEPTEAELRTARIETALTEQGLDPQLHETLPTRLGNLEECRPLERRRYNLAGELVYIIVGTYPDEQAAEACVQAYQAFLGDMWDRFKADFFREGRFVLEVNPKMTADQKKRAIDAVRTSLEG